MKENIGKTIHKIRINKGMKQKDLKDNTISISQISNIEKGLQTPSAEKFIVLLGKLNATYDEFIYLMENEYLTTKTTMENQLAEFVKRQNVNGLKKLAKEAADSFAQYGDIYFHHIELKSLAMIEVILGNNEYQSAREYLHPIKEYLDNIDEWGRYEMRLIGNCLFMFDVDTAISLGEKALNFIEKNYSFYKNENIAGVLLTNLAVYTLDYSQYHHLALKYTQLSISLATTTNDATRVLRSNIIYQVACYKMGNGLYNEEKLKSLIKTFELLEWQNEYLELQKFVQKSGISLEF